MSPRSTKSNHDNAPISASNIAASLNLAAHHSWSGSRGINFIRLQSERKEKVGPDCSQPLSLTKGGTSIALLPASLSRKYDELLRNYTLGDALADGLGDNDALPLGLCDALGLPLTEADGEGDGLSVALILALGEGECDGDREADGLILAEGEGDSDGDNEGEILTEGDNEAEGDTEPDKEAEGDKDVAPTPAGVCNTSRKRHATCTIESVCHANSN